MGETRDLFKKIRDINGIFHPKMDTIKERNGMDLTKAEDTDKRCQEYTELYKKDLHDPDNHDGVKILQARFQQYMNRELPDVQAGFRKGRGTRDQTANICWIIEKAREFQKNICFCFIDYAKAFDCVDHKKLWKILKKMGIPDHLTFLLRNLSADQQATVRTGHGTTDWLQ